MPVCKKSNMNYFCCNQTSESQREIINAIKLFGDEGNLAFNESLTLTFDGFLDEDTFALAISRLIKRHDALRTTFDKDGQKFYVHQNMGAQITYLDLSNKSNTESELNAVEHQAVIEKFDIFSGPLVRVVIIKRQSHHVVVLSLHHIICDGWSFAVLLEDVSLIYSGLISGTHTGLEQPNYYIDFLHSINSKSHQNSQNIDYKYWQKLYEKIPAALELPVDKPRQAVRSLQSQSIEYQFDAKFSQQLKAFARQQNCSIVNVLLAAYASLVYKLSGQREIVIALPAAGQAIEGCYRTIGHCVNTLPIPCYVDPENSFSDFLETFKNNFLDLSDHQRISLGGLLKRLKVDRDSSRLPLASLMFNLDQDMEEFEFSNLLAKVRPNSRLFENFELFVNVVDTKSGYLLQWQYSAALFEPASIETWAKVYHKLLQQMCERPKQSINSFCISLEEDFNHQQKSFSRQQQNKHSLIEQLISKPHFNSDNIAVISAGHQLSYKQIDEQSNQIANFLQAEKSLKAGELIGVCMERSTQLIPVLLAIWKCGCAYVPLDPSFPAARLNYMVSAAQLSVIISSRHLAPIINAQPALDVLCYDQLTDIISKQSSAFSATELSPQSLAYVIFTSGSTGKPKGVMVSQYSVANFISSMAQSPSMGSQDKLLSVTTLSFDISVLELFLPLWTGASVVIASADESKDPGELIKLMTREKINIMQATPSTWQLLLNGGWQGNKNLKVLCGGEAFPQQLAKRLFPLVAELWNMYGPTETTVWSSCFKIENPDKPILIGTPIKHTQCYILDENLQPLPNGFRGELCIGGLGVAAGYLNQSELTRERFVTNTLVDKLDKSEDLIYRSGDKARWNHNGQLEIYGRMDNQVKIRGFRIELGEIESVIQQQAEVEDCVVIVNHAHSENAQLVAYIVWHKKPLTFSALRESLLEWVPAYMVPQVVVDLQELPRLPNGKLNRNALPALTLETSTDESFYEAKSETEIALVEIWKEVLGLETISTHDNFFDLGGHSLLIAKIIRIFEQKQAVLLQYRDIFNCPTISELAAAVDKTPQESMQINTRIVPRTSNQKNVLSLAQQRLWYLNKLSPNTTQFNLPSAFRLTGALNKTALNQAFKEVIARHELLRTAIAEDSGEPTQRVYETLDFVLEEIDLSHLQKEECEQALQKRLDELQLQVFDITKAPLFMSTLIVLNDNEHVLFFMPHHFIFDGMSFDIFIYEISQLYAKNSGVEYQLLPDLPIQYVDYSIWLRELLKGHELDKQLVFWKDTLHGTLPILDMPLDFPRPENLENKGDDVYYEINSDLLGRLTQLANNQESSLFMIMMTAYVSLIYRYSGQTDLVIGTPMADRTRSGTENLMGFFINSLVLRFNIEPDESFEKMLKQVRELCLSGYSNQDVPFEHLVELLNPPRDVSRSPLFQTSVTYRDVTECKMQMSDIDLLQEEVPTREAALDINIWFKNYGHRIRGAVVYNIELFERRTIEQFARHYVSLLESISTSPQQSIRQLKMLSSEEREQQLNLFNTGNISWPGKQQINSLISHQAKQTPQATAICFAEQQISYAELESRSNQFAHYLIEQGVENNVMVGLCIDRSIEMMVALLGILKSGSAYVPLDPEYPKKRLSYMVTDANLQFLVTQQCYIEQLPQVKTTSIIEQCFSSMTAQPETEPQIKSSEEDLAYVIYTSGSTGKPKGVMVQQRAAANFLNSMAQEPGLSKDDNLLAVTTLSFDIAVLELYLPLRVGGQLVIASKDEAIDGRRLLSLIKKHNISAMQATPATWRLLIGSGWSEENKLKVLCGGEALPVDLAANLMTRSSELWNMYGPTETTVWSTYQKVTDASQPLSIGRPIANTQIYILDEQMQPLPQGVAGELYIGGDGVSSGYLNRSELTAEKFVDNPFKETGKLYRSGDKVRYRSDNSLEYMGRLDSQVKVRGYRIELQEIESIMRQHESIIDCALSVKEERAGDARLVAYVVWKDKALTMTELREYLRNWVPAYMVPQHITALAELPVTPNGKLDRNNLPDIFSTAAKASDYIAPRSKEERWLADIWKQMLEVKQVGIYDNFFELGGHSLLSMKVIHQMAETSGVVLNPRDLLLDTLQTIAAKISLNNNVEEDNNNVEDNINVTNENITNENITKVDTKTDRDKRGIKGLIKKIFN